MFAKLCRHLQRRNFDDQSIDSLEVDEPLQQTKTITQTSILMEFLTIIMEYILAVEHSRQYLLPNIFSLPRN
jgi:hypothetical protein